MPEPGLEMELQGHVKAGEPESKREDPATVQPDGSRPDSDGLAWSNQSYVPRIRPSEANGFAVYRRNKRLKSGDSESGSRIVFSDKINGSSEIAKADESVSCDREVGVLRGNEVKTTGGQEGNLENLGEDEGEMMEVEVKEEPVAVTLEKDGLRRFTRSALRFKTESMEIEDESNGELRDAVVLDAEGLEDGTLDVLESATRKMEMKMSKKIVIKGRPTTVRELFETGLLEGYPVFYNGGKRGIPLRGTIKESGILCSCSLCKGARVVPPCQFEIHACKTYRRASQYICLENGKSLLDVVKECRKASLKTLEETILNFIGPLPEKESITCQNCQGSFLATSTTKPDSLCDSCLIVIKSEADAACIKSRPLEPLLGITSSESGKALTTPLKKPRGRKKRKHTELMPNGTTPGRSSMRISSRKSAQWMSKKLSKSSSASPGSSSARLSKLTCVQNSTGSASLLNSVKNKTRRKILKKLALVNSNKVSSTSRSTSSASAQSKGSWKITKKDQRMHKLVFEDGGLPDGTEVSYYSHGKKLREGYKTGSGILCRCCCALVSPSQFEAHAGWASRRKPYNYIYMSNGVSLHEFALSLLKGRKYSAKDNDDLCIICADGGKLVLCDGCPRAFHKECASLLSIPRGKWYCMYCQRMFQRERFVAHNKNAVAAGRVSGIDPIEQITNRCIRIVKKPEEAEVIACVICRGYDFSKSGFGPRTVILCDQCEKEYHVGCLKKCKIADLKELPKGKWFCSGDCKRIYSALQNLVYSGPERLPDSSLDFIRNKQIGNGLEVGADFDVRWRLLNGKVSSRENRLLLSQAVAIFHDCFDPIVDSETGRDFIPSMVYGRNIRGQDFSGMYCAILTVNSWVVSAGIFRIFGQEMAELPLVATRTGNHGKGYFKLLFSCIEKLLAFLNVKSCVLPSAEEAKSIWTEKFGFRRIPQEQLLNYRKICWQMISFKGTSMLEKTVPKCRIISHDGATSTVPSQQNGAATNVPSQQNGVASDLSSHQSGATSDVPMQQNGAASDTPSQQNGAASVLPSQQNEATSDVPLQENGDTSNVPLQQNGAASDVPLQQNVAASDVPLGQNVAASDVPLQQNETT